MKVKSENEAAQSCPTLCDPMDCSLPGSSVHGIFQARVLEWGAIAFSTEMQYMDALSEMTESSLFPRETIHITVLQVYAPTSNAEEAEAEWLYEDLQPGRLF